MTTERQARPHRARACTTALATCALLAAVAWPARAEAGKGAYRTTKHGSTWAGVRKGAGPVGACSACHAEMGRGKGYRAPGPRVWTGFVRLDAGNERCFSCHQTPLGAPAPLGIYQGKITFNQSTHATSPAMAWPGQSPPPRSSADAGRCVNCHDPHGARDAIGVIPSMNVAREEALCLPCHDGAPARRDVASQLQRAFRHPVSLRGVHRADEGGDKARFAAPAARHVECVDCHNPHYARADVPPARAPAASNRLLGVSRVRVTNGGAGSVPLYTFVPAEDVAFALEYEICFKCHSSWTTQPAGQSDLALLLNPANPSFHPVEEVGRNRNIDPLAFAGGWRWDRLTYCSDCHSSDDPSVRGPHGSMYRYLLGRSYTASPLVGASMASTDLCFQCHAFATYADGQASRTVRRYSRWEDHALHVGKGRVPCYTCHATHGSTLYPALVVIGRSPGLSAYLQDVRGGSCASSAACHEAKTYAVTYPR